MFLSRMGIAGNRRFVAVWWSCFGDELGYDDGEISAVGVSDHWVWLDHVHQLGIEQWLLDQDFDLGSTEDEETHWMIVDAKHNVAYIAPKALAKEIVDAQQLKGI